MGTCKMISLALIAISATLLASTSLAGNGEIDTLIWTEVPESDLLTEEEHKVAFREGVIRRAFHVLMESSKLGFGRTNFPSTLLVRDPLPLAQDISFKKTESGLVDIDFKAWDLTISGLHNVWIKNLHVLRHIGLKDIRVVLQLVTDMTFAGNHSLEGTGLSLLPVTGSGALSVKVSDLMLTGETYMIVRE